MHIPDGFLTPPVWATLDALAIPCVAIFTRRAQRSTDESKLPLLGVLGAFVFAAQMINFPVGPGVSGHLVGGALLAATLGPAPAAVVLTAILALQALVFQDGGILSLGANVFNMAIAGVLAGYLPYRMLAARKSLGLFVGALLSVLVSACLALAELLFSGVKMSGGILAVSLGFFVVSAILEGGITVAVVKAIDRLNPAWVPASPESPRRQAGWIAIAAIILAVSGILFASAAPDGIAKLSADLGISTQAKSLFATPLSDYELKALPTEWLRKAAAALCGLALIYFACLGLERLLRRRVSPEA